MEHFDELNTLVDPLIEFCAKQKDNAKYASVIFSIVKLLLSNYSIAEAIGVLSFAEDELKKEKPQNLKELSKCLYI